MTFKFENGSLTPIPDPLPATGDLAELLKAYGFDPYPERIGSEHGMHLAIFGPATGEAPYTYLCELWTFGHALTSVWCENGAALHSYLCDIAPLLTAVNLAQIREAVDEAQRWILDPYDGILRDHIAEVRSRDASLRRERKDGKAA